MIDRHFNHSLSLADSLIAFFLLTTTLRPALTGIGPLLQAIQDDTGLSSVAAGSLTTLPLLIFALAALSSPMLVEFGLERAVVLSTAISGIGIVIRSCGSAMWLLAGTIVLAIGIGMANVLIPSLIKRDFPNRIPTMTAAYVVSMSMAGALASAVVVPLSAVMPGGWRTALGIWAILSALALVAWLSKAKYRSRHPKAPSRANVLTNVWRSPLAWSVATFMGCQSLVYYVVIAWMPTYLIEQGQTAAEAGWLLTLFQTVALVAGLLLPLGMRGRLNQSGIAVTASLVTIVALLGLWLMPSAAIGWLSLLGASTGVTVTLAFTLIGTRAADHASAASLSMMSQSFGYAVAALGPIGVGWLRYVTSGWTWPMAAIVGCVLVQAAAGLRAGIDEQL